ncbi:MAG: cation-transporting P-type ATPase, partial [Thermomicrobiales bacterium]
MTSRPGRQLSEPSQADSSGAWWALEESALYRELGSGDQGLTTEEAARRHSVATKRSRRFEQRRQDLRILLPQFQNPIILILLFATGVSFIAGDRVDASIILVIVVASGGLSFWQERSAGRAVDLLLERVRVEVDVLRDGLPRGIPLDDVVPGDVVLLRSGDIVPGDGRITESHSLLIDHAA